MYEYVMGVHPERFAWSTNKPFIAPEIYGQGVNSIEEAITKLERVGARELELMLPVLRPTYSGRFIGKLRIPCRVCAMIGIQPGYKRKRCGACAGEGSTEHADVIVRVDKS